jgi:hypothetical protein
MRIRFASALAVIAGLACVTQTTMAATWKLNLAVSAPDSTSEQLGMTTGQATGTAQIQITVKYQRGGSTVLTQTIPVRAQWYYNSGTIYIKNWYGYTLVNLPTGVNVGDTVVANVSVSTKVTPPSQMGNLHPQSVSKAGQASGSIIVTYGAWARYNLGMSVSVPLTVSP